MTDGGVASTVADLRAAIASRAWPTALALALDGWRATRSPLLADLVDALGARCEVPLRPPHLRDVHDWWMSHATPYDPVAAAALTGCASLEARGSPPWAEIRGRYPVGHPVIGPLIIAYAESFGTHPPTHMNLVDRLAAMAGWPDDPRAAAPLCAWLVGGVVGWSFDRPPYGEAATVLYELIAGQLARIGDVRTLPALRACAAAPGGSTARLRATQASLARDLVTEIAEPVELDAELAHAIGACTASVPAPRAVPAEDAVLGALWAEIAAHPADDTPRLVLADALTDRGDLRGELIVLQCAGHSSSRPREQALIESNWRDWIGELSPILLRQRCEFRRGMLDAIVVGPLPALAAGSYTGLRGRRELACVTAVRPGAITAPDFATVLDAFDGLDVVGLALPGMLAALRAVRPRWAFRTVELREAAPPLHDSDPVPVVRELVALVPALEQLDVILNLWTPPTYRVAWVEHLATNAPHVRVRLRAGIGFSERAAAGEDLLAGLRDRPQVVIHDDA